MKTSTKDDIKKLAASIENLAKEIQLGIDNGKSVFSTANELIRNNLTMVFALGEVSAAEELQSKQVAVMIVKPGRYTNYHKKRDTLGRFTKI